MLLKKENRESLVFQEHGVFRVFLVEMDSLDVRVAMEIEGVQV